MNTGFSVIIDHSHINPDHLIAANEAAGLDPDGHIFPWRGSYPLDGQMVYWEGEVWTVTDREHPVTDISCVRLVSLCGQDVAIAARGELRPVTWTQHDEDWLGRE